MAADFKGKIRDTLRSAVQSLREFAYAHPIPTRHRIPTRPRVGLALGGGFARGLAHIGVLKVLRDNQIPIDALAGTSIGSIVAAAFASGVTLEEMAEEARKIRWRSFARWTVARLGLASNERMEEMLRRVLRRSTFEELAIPLAVVATDVSTGEAVTFRHGELIHPLRASCSFPGLFVPIEYQRRLLVDGAIVGSVPVAALRDFNVDAIIAVFLPTNGPHHAPTNIIQVVGQAFQIAQSFNKVTWKESCDLVIEPDVNEFKWDDFERADDLMLAGARAALEALPALRELLQPRLARRIRRPTPPP